LPTAVPPSTPAPSPSPGFGPALVTYEREGSLYAYDGRASRTVLRDGRAYNPVLSPDGRRVSFRRHEEPTALSAQPFSLWLLDLSTGRETAVDLAALPPFPFNLEGRDLGLPRWPWSAAWLPAGDAFLFSTWVDFSAVGPGLLLSDDLWRVDAATGQMRNLFPETEPPASFTLSPDGRRVLVNRPTRIEALDLASGERHTLLEFAAVATYSEYSWLPEPRWLPDSRVTHVAVAPPDPMQSAAFALWRLDTEKGTAQRLGEVNGSVFAWSPNGPSWSPDGTRLAYVSAREGQRNVYLANADGTAEVPLLRGEEMPGVLGWSPDGQTILCQQGVAVYAVAVGPELSARQLVDVSGVAQASWAEGVVLLVTSEGRLLRVVLDGSGVQDIP
jgi:Tol biopolymer transport system component